MSRKTIMLVDDNRNTLVTLGDFLRYKGYDVVEASSGEQALKVLGQITPDLMVLDISMPGIGGVGVLKQLHDANGKTPFPVLVFTARAEMADFFDSLDVHGFLSKTASELEVLDKIQNILQHKPEPEAPKAEDAGSPSATSGFRVLVGESDVLLSHKIQQVFADNGYEVKTVSTGPELLEAAVTFQPAIILMNDILPYMNGGAAAAVLAHMPSCRAVPLALYEDSVTSGMKAHLPNGSHVHHCAADPQALLALTKKILA